MQVFYIKTLLTYDIMLHRRIETRVVTFHHFLKTSQLSLDFMADHPRRGVYLLAFCVGDVKRDSPRVLAFLPAHTHTPHTTDTTDTIKITKIMLKLETQGALRRNLRVSIPQFSQQSAQPVLRFFNANEPRMQTRRTRSSFSGGRQ
jgi:hypothetical protein